MSEPVDKTRLYDLVVMGASAGGIEALSVLVATLPPTLPVPVVIAQHLDPNVPSHLGQILARRSKLPVHTVGEAEPNPERLMAGTIYVVPSDRDVEISDGIVRLLHGVRQHPLPSIDRLFTSAAEVYGERVIAVVLTGSGSDGTVGARAVKSAGGTVLIENPQTASYPTMPASLPPTSVDLVVDLDHMGPLIADLISGTQSLSGPPSGDTLSALLEQVRQNTNIDFSQYKRPTILRRLHRRMAATNSATLQDYQQVLQNHPEEYRHLVASFLINVTEFFRDPALFDFVRDQILPDVIAYARTHGPAHEIRIWSAGCSTGEEPYSVAMLLAEALGSDALQFTVRIFATDVDTDAVVFARRGRYPAAALANVPEHLRTRYFTPVDNSFEISKAIRSMVIFGEHDLGQRAPFPHMDLVICRNVLIYFTSELQVRSLKLFAFSLRDGGYLVLGSAESVGTLSQYFGQAHARFKVYRRQGEHVLVPPLPVGGRLHYETDLPTERRNPPQARLRLIPNPMSSEGQSPVPELAENEIAGAGADAGTRLYTARERFADQILSLPMGVIVVDRNYDILTINSAAYVLFDMHRPAVGKDLLHLAERVPTKPLRAAIDQTFEILGASETTESSTSAAASTSMVSVQLELEQSEPGERHLLQISCYPHLGTTYTVDGGTKPTVDSVVLFISEIPVAKSTPEAAGGVASSPGGVVVESEGPPPSAPAESARDETLQRLTQQVEMERARVRELRTATQELRDDNERLRRINEDLVVGQEEVQASSEETKTFNEEMQATNEELETLNEELEATVEELRTTNDDLAARAQEQRAFVDQKEAERQIVEQDRAQLEAIVSSIGDAVMAVDAKGEQILANEAYRQIFGGIDATADIGDEHGEPLMWESWPWRRIGQASPFRMVFSLRMSAGLRRWFEAVGQPIFRDERRLGGVLTIHDLADQTLRNLYERFYMQAGQEFTMPLAMLTAAIQQVAEHLPALGDGDQEHEQRHKEMVSAQRQVHHLGIIVGDLTDPEQTRQDRLQLAHEPVDLVEIIQQVVRDIELARSVAQSVPSTPRIVVRMEVEPEQSITVIGDAVRLEQVVRNLLFNALAEAPESERVDVRIRRLPGHATPETAEFEVQDYGRGFPEGDRALILTPPFQGPQGSLTFRGPLVLGFYIAQQIIQAHDGTMELRSPEGLGNILTVRLPLESKGQHASMSATRRQTKRSDPSQ
jgi:two-component system, chemotaxis family, CheB/CheR fusion protein